MEIVEVSTQPTDIGPKAGKFGGEIVFQGNHKQLLKAKNSLTASYLTGKTIIPVPERRRKLNSHILIKGARENNRKIQQYEIG